MLGHLCWVRSTRHTTEKELKYRREIDGLRALAVLPVILFHAGVEAVSGGFVGVDVFFVISGYLITSIIITERKRGSFSLRGFYARRVRRILPALFVVVVCCLPFAWFWMIPPQRLDFSMSIASVATFSSNIFFWLTSGYFGPAVEEIPLLHTWSLAVEEQYYLFFPPFVLALWRWGRRPLVCAIVLLALASLGLAEYGAREFPTGNFYMAPTRAWELLAGSLCAFWQAERTQQGNSTLAGFGLVLILLSVFAFDKDTPFPSLYALLPVGGSVLVILFASKGTPAARLLSTKPMVGIGLVSYSAYLWHQPLFAFARIRSALIPELSTMLGLSLLSLVLAYVSWRFVEQPFRKKGGAITPTRVLKLGAFASLLVLSLGLWGYSTDGFASASFTARQIALIETIEQDPLSLRCGDHRPPEESCLSTDSEVKWAVLGDSHGAELAGALSIMLKPEGIGLRQLTYRACPPSYGRDKMLCSDWTKEVIAHLTGDAKVTTVVVAYRLNYHLYGDHRGVYPRYPSDIDQVERRLRWDSLRAMVDALIEADKSVVLVLQIPELQAHVFRVISDYGEDLHGVSREWWRRRSAFVYERLASLPSEVVVVDPADLFCDQSQCYVGQEETAHYFDDNHPSVSGAEVMARAIMQRLKATKK
jgi:peptidoglycan/LPS O-acetylase OafA/YrhL